MRSSIDCSVPSSRTQGLFSDPGGGTPEGLRSEEDCVGGREVHPNLEYCCTVSRGYAEGMRLLRVAAALTVLAAAWGVAGGACSSGQSCAERTSDARNAMLAAASQAYDADVGCTRDSDCILASDNGTCGDGYACGIVVNAAGAAALQAVIAKINATTCANFVADGCEPPVAPPCAPSIPSCVAGKCQSFPGPEDAGTDASLGCLQETAAAEGAIAAAASQAGADRSCSSVADCVFVPTVTACTFDCSGVILNTAGAAELESAMAQIRATSCPDFVPDGGCLPVASAPCPPLAPIACVGGTCGVSQAGAEAGVLADAASDGASE
jgi:hypothetical protein